MVELNKAAKKVLNVNKYIQIRSLKDYNPTQFVENIKNHHKLIRDNV